MYVFCNNQKKKKHFTYIKTNHNMYIKTNHNVLFRGNLVNYMLNVTNILSLSTVILITDLKNQNKTD